MSFVSNNYVDSSVSFVNIKVCPTCSTRNVQAKILNNRLVDAYEDRFFLNNIFNAHFVTLEY